MKAFLSALLLLALAAPANGEASAFTRECYGPTVEILLVHGEVTRETEGQPKEGALLSIPFEVGRTSPIWLGRREPGWQERMDRECIPEPLEIDYLFLFWRGGPPLPAYGSGPDLPAFTKFKLRYTTAPEARFFESYRNVYDGVRARAGEHEIADFMAAGSEVHGRHIYKSTTPWLTDQGNARWIDCIMGGCETTFKVAENVRVRLWWDPDIPTDLSFGPGPNAVLPERWKELVERSERMIESMIVGLVPDRD